MEEALLWSKEKRKIRCELCARYCLIENNKAGYCGVRVNKNESLYSKNFGKIIHMETSNIEKVPLFHFYPGSKTLSIAATGCNFRCNFCLNHDISHTKVAKGEKYTPEDIIGIANKKKIKIISFAHTEPTVNFEFAYKVARLAKRYDIKTIFVTNSYMTSDAIKKIGKYLDAVSIDIKASADPEFYKKYMDVQDVSPIFDAIRSFKKHRVFIEISNLIIPGIGDSMEFNKKLVDWIINRLDSTIPYHVLGFTPIGKLSHISPTPLDTLEKIATNSKRRGLRYIYIDGYGKNKFQNTYCYNCGNEVVSRLGSKVSEINIVNGRCPNCGYKIDVVRE